MPSESHKRRAPYQRQQDQLDTLHNNYDNLLEAHNLLRDSHNGLIVNISDEIHRLGVKLLHLENKHVSLRDTSLRASLTLALSITSWFAVVYLLLTK